MSMTMAMVSSCEPHHAMCRVRLQLGQGIVGLLQLHRLSHVSFAGSSVHRDKDHGYFADLMHTFARLRPEVKLAFYSCMMLNVVSRISIILHSLHMQLMRRTPTAYHCHCHGHAQTWQHLLA